MTTQPISAKTDGGPPAGEALLTSSSYESAVAAVDALADAHFPVERVTIVGRGVRTVERSPVGPGTPARSQAARSTAA